jgi:glutamyl-tRNA synthetase
LKELVEAFSLDRVHKSGARFDPEKTKWYNHQYLQIQNDVTLAESFIPLLTKELNSKAAVFNADYVRQVVSLIKERASFVHEFWELSSYFFLAPSVFNDKAVKKHWKEKTPEILSQLIPVLEEIHEFETSCIETSCKNWIAGQGLSFGMVMPPLRLAIVGDLKGPHLFDIMALIGKEETSNRLRKAIATL